MTCINKNDYIYEKNDCLYKKRPVRIRRLPVSPHLPDDLREGERL